MNFKHTLTHSIWLILLLLQSCTSQNRLVVYADPWLGEFADSLVAEYQSNHPATEIQLKKLSTEVIVQHLRYGQPIDVVLAFGSEWYPQPDFRTKMAKESTLAPSKVVLLKQTDDSWTEKQRAMGCMNCVVMEASDRPLRHYTKQAGWEQLPPPDRVLIANFQRQAADYLQRGWAPKGFLPLHFAHQHAQQFKIEQQGPLITNAFTAILITNAPNSTPAAEFFALANSEKSRAMLGRMRFLP